MSGLEVADTASAAAGSMTPITGTEYPNDSEVLHGNGRDRIAGHNDQLDVMLQHRKFSTLLRVGVALFRRIDCRMARVPCHPGTRTVRAAGDAPDAVNTVSPPMPESKTPIGRGSVGMGGKIRVILTS